MMKGTNNKIPNCCAERRSLNREEKEHIDLDGQNADEGRDQQKQDTHERIRVVRMLQPARGDGIDDAHVDNPPMQVAIMVGTKATMLFPSDNSSSVTGVASKGSDFY